MSLILDGTNGLTFNNATTQNSGGKVIQVVSASVTGTYGTPYFSTTTNGLVNTGLSATITPLFNTSKVLVLVNACIRIVGTTVDGGTGFGIARGATNIWAGSSIHMYAGSGASTALVSIQNVQYLDSPATTSATTYNFQVNRYTNNGGSTVYLNYNYNAGGSIQSDISNIILMEVAA
jgi:hypothetical protein